MRTLPHYEFRGTPVDVIPYGPSEDSSRTVTFDNDHVLDVTGFAEAAERPVLATLPGGSRVAVASLESQSILKILAWRDRGDHTHRKDALDLETILAAASSGIYRERLWRDDALERYAFDIDLAGAHRLGCEAAATLGPVAHSSVLAVVGDEERDSLARAMKGLLSRERLNAYLEGVVTGGPVH